MRLRELLQLDFEVFLLEFPDGYYLQIAGSKGDQSFKVIKHLVRASFS